MRSCIGQSGVRFASLVCVLALLSFPQFAIAEQVVVGFKGRVANIRTLNTEVLAQEGDVVNGYFMFEADNPGKTLGLEFAFGVPADPDSRVRRTRAEGLTLYGAEVNYCLSSPFATRPPPGLVIPPPTGAFNWDPWTYADFDITYAPDQGFDCGAIPLLLPPHSSFITGNGWFSWGYEDEFGDVAGYAQVHVVIESLFDVPQACWEPEPQTDDYQVLRAVDGSFSSCRTRFGEQQCWRDLTNPNPGNVLYYLARPASPFVGDWGVDSSGLVRQVGCSRCPLDSSGPLQIGACMECYEQWEACEHLGGLAQDDSSCPIITRETPWYCIDDPYCNGQCTPNHCQLRGGSVLDDPACDSASGQICVDVDDLQRRCIQGV